jgi:hypothetical protein
MASWRERESETQARSRDDNESTARVRASAPADGGMSSFRCECGDEDCTCTIRLTAAEYESVRAYATHFAIARDHENPESELVVGESERFAVIETVSPEATKLARRSDPRWDREQRAGPLPDNPRSFVPPLAPAPLAAEGRVSRAQEGTERGRKPGRASDLTSVEKRRRSSRWPP